MCVMLVLSSSLILCVVVVDIFCGVMLCVISVVMRCRVACSLVRWPSLLWLVVFDSVGLISAVNLVSWCSMWLGSGVFYVLVVIEF